MLMPPSFTDKDWPDTLPLFEEEVRAFFVVSMPTFNVTLVAFFCALFTVLYPLPFMREGVGGGRAKYNFAVWRFLSSQFMNH